MRADAGPGPRLVPFEPGQAPRVATWARGSAEVLAWCARDEEAVEPAVIAAWVAAPDVEAWLLVDAVTGEPVAYGELWLDPDEGDGEVELARLIVAPAARGRGLGRHLARGLATRAAAAIPGAQVVLRVLPGNEPALRAYAAAGFERVDPATEAAWNEGQRRPWSWMRLA